MTSPPYWGLRKYAGEQGDEPSLVNMHGLQKVKLVLAVPMDGITTSRRIEGSATP